MLRPGKHFDTESLLIIMAYKNIDATDSLHIKLDEINEKLSLLDHASNK